MEGGGEREVGRGRERVRKTGRFLGEKKNRQKKISRPREGREWEGGGGGKGEGREGGGEGERGREGRGGGIEVGGTLVFSTSIWTMCVSTLHNKTSRFRY